jgi:hypothetical protein
VGLIPEIVTILVAAIMADETAQAAVVAVAVVEAVVAVAVVEAAVAVVAVEAAVVVVAVVVAAVATVDVTAVVTADVVTAIAPITSKVIDALTTKRSRAIHTLVLTEVTVQKGKKSHFKDDQRSGAEVIEAVELAIVKSATNIEN